MSNIYNCWKYFLAEYIYPWFDVKIYPFEFMDGMYDIEEIMVIIAIPNEDKKKRILQKINDYESLDTEEYRYLQTLPASELLYFIRLYNQRTCGSPNPSLLDGSIQE